MLLRQKDPPPLAPPVKEKNRKLHGGVRTRLQGAMTCPHDGQSSVEWNEDGKGRGGVDGGQGGEVGRDDKE